MSEEKITYLLTYLLTVGNRDGARYPRREHKVPSHLSDYDLSGDQINTVIDQMYANIDYCFKSSTVIIPKSYKQALASPDAERWKLSMGEEIKALQDNNTFSVVELPNGRTLVGVGGYMLLKVVLMAVMFSKHVMLQRVTSKYMDQTISIYFRQLLK